MTSVEPGSVVVVRFASEGGERKLMADYAPLKKASSLGARIIDGKAVAARVRAQVRPTASTPSRGARLCSRPRHGPGGRRPASHVYVGNKIKACEEAGIRSIHHGLEPTCRRPTSSPDRDLNADDDVDGILVQMPLPDGLDQDAVIATINPPRTSTASRQPAQAFWPRAVPAWCRVRPRASWSSSGLRNRSLGRGRGRCGPVDPRRQAHGGAAHKRERNRDGLSLAYA